ncbi:hypothetical protein PFUGPA_04822 [Plasmodium falciparum Palo Alto/Uganda]|uniref:Uncharacterized protein n=7 Tax=Plasmodium falciparum TaxID=5833 RepID=A0A024WAM9_PLAFA|nr:hypothetical protein PFFVO_01402 [Plasmodium falciparum Vietnam Oak-Knoll (FVO)]ETW37817.1 hypothetical protein PFTANZ_01467 [Plasmodium falciparum Tanzania (2000708)]ETW44260.1 hypothetical protein PFNF135_01510 [Plasmodium falciparum NF135/5.C10]ETW53194.1 hypothetical protein PFUGPA_04822 [Plasmodium falciparum Palo Alto/Uganda]
MEKKIKRKDDSKSIKPSNIEKNHMDNYINYTLKKGYKENKDVYKNDMIDLQMTQLIEHLYGLKMKLQKEKKKEKYISRDNFPNEKKKYMSIKKKRSETDEKNNYNKLIIPKSNQNMKYVPELLRAIDIYKNKHTEEQKNRMDTEEKYEQMVRNLKKKHISEINEIKNNILEDVNLLIQKYRTISLKLLNITNKKELEKKKITEICVSACKQFEDDVKDKAKISMEEYKSHIMYSVNKIKEEKHNLEKKMRYMQKQHEEEKKILEDEKETILLKHKIKEEKTLNEKIQSERFLEKRNIINDLYSKVDVQIKNYEENIIRVFLDILTKHDIKMDAKELSSYIKNAMYNYYKDEQIDKSRQNGGKREEDQINYAFTCTNN